MLLRPPTFLLNLFTYRQLYSYTLALSSFLLFLLFTLLSHLIKLLYLKLVSNNSTNVTTSSPNKDQLNGDSNSIELLKASALPYQGLYDPSEPFNLNRKYRYLLVLSFALSWLAYCYLAGVFVAASAFGFLPVWISIIVVIIILSTRGTQSFYRRCASYFETQPTGISYYRDTWLAMKQRNPRLFLGYLIFIICASLLMPLTTYKSCINDHVEGYGIGFGMFIYSSAFTRYLTLPKVCGEGGPCHMYATLPFNTSSSVFINIHTSTQVDVLTINYDTTENFQEKGTLAFSQNSSLVIQPDYDVTGDRSIHSVLLTDLLPDQAYTLQVFYQGELQTTKTYMTLPDSNAKQNYTMIYGGDIGYTGTSVQMAKIVAEKDPRAIVIGGDIAYDDGASSCYYSMDLFLWMMETEIFDKVGRLVPMMLGLGNHDIGFSSRANAKMPINNDGPSFYTNFPQSVATGNGASQNTIPIVEKRSAYRAHMIGDILHVFLDSGYLASYDGEQLEWLRNISETYKNSPKIAVYHDPIFSPCYYKNDPSETKYTGADDWVPVFTEYKYMMVFENHIHMYKKTYPLVGTEVSKNGVGTVYLGDGSWGPLGHCIQGDSIVTSGIFESYDGANHVWIVEIDPVNSVFSALPIGLDNAAIDRAVVQDMTLYGEL